MPVPGRSKRRQEYYAQQALLPFDLDGPTSDVPPTAPLNLVLHWNPDSEYNLETVYLGCPKKGGETRASVESHWDELIWRRHDLLTDGTQTEAEVTDLSEICLTSDEIETEA